MKLLRVFIALCVAVLANTVANAAATITPDDFAFGMPLQLQSDAAIFTLPVPREVYQHSVRTDLGDMRVFNADGEWVTYSLSTPLVSTQRAPLVKVPMFPLYGDPQRALDRVRITIAAEQGAVNLQTTSGASSPAQIQSYVIDTRTLAQPVAALELRWPADAAEFSGHVDLQSSDDLGNWTTVASNLPVVNLKFGDQQLLQNRLEFPALKTKYLRLQWRDRAAPFALTEVVAEVIHTQTQPARTEAEATGTAIADQPDSFSFTLPLHAPVDRVNLKLPQTNTIATVTLSSREEATLPWREIVTLRVYDLLNNGAALRNGAVAIEPNTDRYWRVQTRTAGAMGTGVPVLQVAWAPQEITFVARGRAPFQLAYGSAGITSATSPLRSLLADPNTPISVGKATAGPQQELGGITRLQAKAELPWKTWALWAALFAAVAILGALAYRLSREMSK